MHRAGTDALLSMLACVAFAACGSRGTGASGPGEGDGSSVPDAGRIGLCPLEPEPACARAADCGRADEHPPSNCAGCRPYNHGLCATAVCQTPARLGAGDIHQIRLEVPADLRVQSFSGQILAVTTAGGSSVTCADVYDGRVDLSEPCYNIIDSRGKAAISQSGDVYQIDFSGFAGVDRALFLVFGYALEGAEGDPVGVSCTEAEVGSPGKGAQLVPGDRMRRLE